MTVFPGRQDTRDIAFDPSANHRRHHSSLTAPGSTRAPPPEHHQYIMHRRGGSTRRCLRCQRTSVTERCQRTLFVRARAAPRGQLLVRAAPRGKLFVRAAPRGRPVVRAALRGRLLACSCAGAVALRGQLWAAKRGACGSLRLTVQPPGGTGRAAQGNHRRTCWVSVLVVPRRGGDSETNAVQWPPHRTRRQQATSDHTKW